ncbi:hypothetical protein UCRPA7_951 [Phaeoacremonium minimum UCRPA7]|uniref:Uncharacterized protein n=1 Tax=Phaeoacremonium minimum (strain UCR-PA7) TaxID=1286976 RepID=R8BVW0_PHAM7|nr:hypothetical protein UCRPA7_951 [Phaeoacremonium minimum UCRPA7]EOO03487.1 hypothetical protein UCRPA7_951 [Phaeoacremonium minimum UCRPA7]
MDTGAMGNIFAETSNVETYDLGANASGLPTSMQATYDAALMQGVETKLSPRDAWGNPKIPRLELFDQSTADADGWVDVTDVKTVETYSSLMGMPIIGVPKNGTAEFSIESSYIALGLPAVQYSSRVGGTLGLTVTCPDCINWAHNYHPDNMTVMQARQLQLMGPPFPQPNATERENASYTKANYIRFDQEFGGDVGLALTDVTQKLVETTIFCDSGNCQATKMRVLTTDHRPENITAFDWWGTFALDMITAACTRESSQTASPTEFFLNASSQIPINRQVLYTGVAMAVNFSTINPNDLSNRATALLNTALQIFYSPFGFAGSLPTENMTIYGPAHIPSNGINETIKALGLDPDEIDYTSLIMTSQTNNAPFIGASTNAKVILYTEVYKPDYAWVVILALSSIVLSATGLLGIIMGLRTTAPDVFDPVMALTYDNPYLGMPMGGSTLSAADRARLMAFLKVRLGDIRGADDVGKIALARTADTHPLMRGRLYE